MNGFRNEFGSGRRKLLVATISLVFGIAACNLLSEVFIRVPQARLWMGGRAGFR